MGAFSFTVHHLIQPFIILTKKKCRIILCVTKEHLYLTISKTKNMKTLKDIKVENTITVTSEMLEMLKNTQEFGKRFFNEQPWSVSDMQLRINSLQKKFQVSKITDGVNILISVNNKIWDGVSMLSK